MPAEEEEGKARAYRLQESESPKGRFLTYCSLAGTTEVSSDITQDRGTLWPPYPFNRNRHDSINIALNRTQRGPCHRGTLIKR